MELLLFVLSFAISILALVFALTGHRKVKVITQAQAVVGENKLDLYYHDLMRQLREIGEPKIHIHDIEVLAKKTLGKLR